MPTEMQRKFDNEWLTEERKKRMFNPTVQEKAIMETLVKKDILENHHWGGKPSYRPTQRFADLVAKEAIDLLLNQAFFASMQTQREEGTKIAIKRILPEASMVDIDNYTEIVSPFLLFDDMDRDLNPASDRYKPRKASEKEVEKSVQQWLQEEGFKVEKKESANLDYWAYAFGKGGHQFLVFKSGIDILIIGNLVPWPSFDLKNEEDAQMMKKLHLSEEKVVTSLLTLKDKLKGLNLTISWYPGRRSTLAIGRMIRFDDLSKKLVAEISANLLKVDDIVTGIFGDLLTQKPKSGDQTIAKTELAGNEAWKKDSLVKERVFKWLETHRLVAESILVLRPIVNEAAFAFKCKFGHGILVVYKPKGKDEIVLALPETTSFDTEKHLERHADMFNADGRKLLRELETDLSKTGCTFRILRVPNTLEIMSLVEKSIPYDQLSENYFVDSINDLVEAFKKCLVIIDRTQLEQLYQMQERMRDLISSRKQKDLGT